MPKLVKLETDKNVSNYTPETGNITTFFVKEGGAVKLKAKNSSGDIIAFETDALDTAVQPDPSVEIDWDSMNIVAAYTPVAGKVVDTETRTKTIPLRKTVPDPPEIYLDASTGSVRASYMLVGQYAIKETVWPSTTLQLPTIAEQTITPGTEDIVLEAGNFLTGDVTIVGDENLIPENIKKGTSIFGVTGSLTGGAEPEVASSCIAYLGGNGCLYVLANSGATVSGLARNAEEDRGDWLAYGPFAQPGPFAGSALSQDGVCLEWDGFSDHSLKYTIHTLIGDTDASSVYDAVKYAWGFDEQDYNWEDNYELSGLEMYWYSTGYDWDGAGARFYDGWVGRTIMKAGLLPAAFTWDGPGNVAVNLITARGDRYKRTLMYPYDEEMGMPGQKYIVGNKLYLGKPPRYTNGTSGAIIGGFALEVGSSGYTDGASYISPLLDGTYKNL
jgi:hypothetical protein